MRRIKELEGISEGAARSFADERDWSVRIVGEDGECLGRNDDLRPDRLNMFLDDGEVVWAGRF